MLKTLYPSKNQQHNLWQILACARHFDNRCVDERSVSKTQQMRNVKHDKKTLPQAQIVHSHVLQVVAADCDKAFQAFFRRVKKGETPGYPRFKGRHRFHSFGFRMAGRRLKVSGGGSRNRRKALLQVHVANQRRDYLHKLSTQLVEHDDLIALEDLQVRNRVRNQHLRASWRVAANLRFGVFSNNILRTRLAVPDVKCCWLIPPTHPKPALTVVQSSRAYHSRRDGWHALVISRSIETTTQQFISLPKLYRARSDGSVQPHVAGGSSCVL